MSDATLYRKYRPRRLRDVVGQKQVVQTIRHAFESGELAHAFLFTGAHGTGKTTTAKILAKLVNCENPQDGEPCNVCQNCTLADRNAHPDIIEMDAASNRGIDNIREVIASVPSRPQVGNFRIYIIDEVHMLTTEAFNALLKNLEEPPSHVIFILATTEVHKVLKTIISRCQPHYFRRIAPKQVTATLIQIAMKEGFKLNKEAAHLIAIQTNGALRDAIGMIQQLHEFAGDNPITVEMIDDFNGSIGSERLGELLTLIESGNVGGVVARLNEIYTDGTEPIRLLLDYEEYLRKCWLVSIDAGTEEYANIRQDERENIMAFAGRHDARYFMTLIGLVESGIDRLKNSNTNAKLALEAAFVKMVDPSMDEGVIGISARLDEIEKRI